MFKEFLKGVYIGLGILFVFSLLGMVYAVGFHAASEILPGSFQAGNYFFNGNVGIGTLNPSSKFHINSTGSIITLQDYDSNLSVNGHNSGIRFIDANGTRVGDIGYMTGGQSMNLVNLNTNGNIGFWTNGSNRMTIYNNGNVGIGTNAVVSARIVSQVEKDGDWGIVVANSDGYRIGGIYPSSGDAVILLRNSTASNKVAIKSNGNSYFNGGNVGIGKDNPLTMLDVSGRTNSRTFGERVAQLVEVSNGATTTFDVCYNEGGLIYIGGSSGSNSYQSSQLFHYFSSSGGQVFIEPISEAGDLTYQKFSLSVVSSGSTGSSRCSGWYSRVQVQATGSYSIQNADVVLLNLVTLFVY